MLRFFLIFLLVASNILCSAQAGETGVADSFDVLIVRIKDDTQKVNLLWNRGNELSVNNPEKAFRITSDGLFLAQQLKYKSGESRSLGILANILMAMGNYPTALSYNFKKLKLEEDGKNPRNLASVLMNIGIVYVLQEQYNDALRYYFKADSLIRKYDLQDLYYNIAINLGDVYDRLNKNDSAYKYFNESLTIARTRKDAYAVGASLTGLGHSYSKTADYTLALVSYTEALKNLRERNDLDMICETSLGLAGMFKKQNNSDSAFKYARLSLQTAKEGSFLPRALQASEFLSGLFKATNNGDSAYAYLVFVNEIKNSIYSKENIRRSQILSSNETLRQLEMEETKKRAKKERSQQLQMLFIGIFIPMFFMITLLLSRVKMHLKFMRVLGVLSLLFLFEYLTLLLHPLVATLTHHTPILEMLIFVGLAAILIPLHHKLEHWFVGWLFRNRPAITTGKINLKVMEIQLPK